MKEYQDKHPELAEELGQLFPLVEIMEQCGPGGVGSVHSRNTASRAVISAGTRLGRYVVLAPLGSGGMGDVYRGRDERLDREVAVKVLPPAFARDAGRLARFEREVRAVAALSHPNILSIHDYGTDVGICFAIMELLEGQTLRQHLAGKGLPWRDALHIGVGVADGLAAAHARGIIHRDLKPENLFLTRDGQIKILDFGLARVDDPQSAAHSETASFHSDLTDPGTMLGTVGYMPPEQVRGWSTDARADIFSLGCILYEMLTGQRAFAGPSRADVLAATLHKDLPKHWNVSGGLPEEVLPLVEHCMAKKAEERLGSARDIAMALRNVLADASGSSSIESIPAPTKRRRSKTADTRERRRMDDEAYRLYLEGRYHWNKRTEDGLRKSIATFYQALDQNANYAPAWAGLADAYQQLGLWGHAPATSASSKAKSAALRAIELDNSLVEAHSTLAVILKEYEWDFPGAEQAFQRALELNPLHAVTHQWYGECLASMGRHTDAIAALSRAQDLDPLSANISTTVGRQGFFYARQYDRAVDQLRRTIQTDATFWIAHHFLGWVYIMQRQLPQALAAFEQAKKLDDNPEPLVGLGYAYAVSGEASKAREYLAALTELGRHRYLAPINIAMLHIGLHETDQAFVWLDKAYDDRSQWLSDIVVDPAFDPVRHDPRFGNLLRRMKFTAHVSTIKHPPATPPSASE